MVFKFRNAWFWESSLVASGLKFLCMLHRIPNCLDLVGQMLYEVGHFTQSQDQDLRLHFPCPIRVSCHTQSDFLFIYLSHGSEA